MVNALEKDMRRQNPQDLLIGHFEQAQRTGIAWRGKVEMRNVDRKVSTQGIHGWRQIRAHERDTYPLGALAMTLWGFAVFTAVHLLAVIVVAIGPFAIALAAIPSTRRYAWGWLGVVLWSVASVALISLVLGIGISVITQEDQTLGALDQNVSIYDQVDGFFGVVGALGLLACVITAMPWLAVYDAFRLSDHPRHPIFLEPLSGAGHRSP